VVHVRVRQEDRFRLGSPALEGVGDSRRIRSGVDDDGPVSGGTPNEEAVRLDRADDQGFDDEIDKALW